MYIYPIKHTLGLDNKNTVYHNQIINHLKLIDHEKIYFIDGVFISLLSS